jgi:hypothetical protein
MRETKNTKNAGMNTKNTKGITSKNSKDRRVPGNYPRREPPVPQDPSRTYLE